MFKHRFSGTVSAGRLLQAAQAVASRTAGSPLWLTVNAQNDRAITF